jgi:hypothetical protein
MDHYCVVRVEAADLARVEAADLARARATAGRPYEAVQSSHMPYKTMRAAP